MGTAASIAIEKLNGEVQEVYVNYDGGVNNVGAMLYLYYDVPERIKELISLGNMSSLRKNIHPPKGVEHNQYKYEENTTLFYKRDYGREEEGKTKKYASLKDWLAFEVEINTYIFVEKENNWYYVTLNNNGYNSMYLLEEILKNTEIYKPLKNDVIEKIVTKAKENLEKVLIEDENLKYSPKLKI